jgi:hypothetical protein
MEKVQEKTVRAFPFLLIPGFLVPLAVLLHVLAIRAITSQLRTTMVSTAASPA